MAVEALVRTSIAKRRSTRIAMNAPVGITGEDRQKCSFTVTAKATNLNRHGAALQLSRELPVGATILVRNKRGAQVPARIVAQVNAGQGLQTYGIEFVEQDAKANAFWGITFPSSQA